MPEPAHRPAPVPEGYTTVTPWIITRDTRALFAFLKAAFDAQELACVPNEDGAIGHAEARIGDAVVMAFDARPEWPDTPAFMRLYLPDGDAVFRRALDAGATAVTAMTDLAWGDRVGRVRDPFGNVWWIQTRVEEPDPAEVERRFGEATYADAMRYVQGSLDEELSGRA
ncbi:VOC family protein [Streptomyces sp. A7024]|uniref:VOC family protein n=1 Tax=Streptomyces coryli TaxID=1128680 RepID=A0A6G4U5J8_9ACTN|nr:VOC family protein [Streptomyces coryli]NGN66567.1 VOC family protein [Streptomyces coryli]